MNSALSWLIIGVGFNLYPEVKRNPSLYSFSSRKKKKKESVVKNGLLTGTLVEWRVCELVHNLRLPFFFWPLLKKGSNELANFVVEKILPKPPLESWSAELTWRFVMTHPAISPYGTALDRVNGLSIFKWSPSSSDRLSTIRDFENLQGGKSDGYGMLQQYPLRCF